MDESLQASIKWFSRKCCVTEDSATWSTEHEFNALAALKTMEWIEKLKVNYANSVDPLARRTILDKFNAYRRSE